MTGNDVRGRCQQSASKVSKRRSKCRTLPRPGLSATELVSMPADPQKQHCSSLGTAT